MDALLFIFQLQFKKKNPHKSNKNIMFYVQSCITNSALCENTF